MMWDVFGLILYLMIVLLLIVCVHCQLNMLSLDGSKVSMEILGMYSSGRGEDRIKVMAGETEIVSCSHS
jgi:hypothetical protein